jgi:hypothetical protein
MVNNMHNSLRRRQLTPVFIHIIRTLVTGKSASVTVETLLSTSWPAVICVPIYKKLPVWILVADELNDDVLSCVLGI